MYIASGHTIRRLKGDITLQKSSVFGQASCVLQRSKMEVKRSELFTSPNIFMQCKAIYIGILIFVPTPSLSIFVEDKKNYDNEILSNKFVNKFTM